MLKLPSITQETARRPAKPGRTFLLPRAPASTPGEYGDSDAYDRYMGRWSVLLAREFVDFIEIGKADRVLDVGSGTGSLTGVIAASTAASRIVGIDPVASFVDAARSRFADPRMTFDRGDVGALPYPDSHFDATLSQLSFHHFRNAEQGLNEMLRVTRSGGVVAACDWDSESGMELFHVLWETLESVHPPSGRRHEVRHYLGPGSFAARWKARGITAVAETALLIPLTFAGFEDFWDSFIESPSSVILRLNRLSSSLKEAFRCRLRKTLLKGRSHGPITLQARAWAVRGLAP